MRTRLGMSRCTATVLTYSFFITRCSMAYKSRSKSLALGLTRASRRMSFAAVIRLPSTTTSATRRSSFQTLTYTARLSTPSTSNAIRRKLFLALGRFGMSSTIVWIISGHPCKLFLIKSNQLEINFEMDTAGVADYSLCVMDQRVNV